MVENPTEAQLVQFTTRLLWEHGLYGWTVTWNRARTQAGKCVYPEKAIYFSRPVLKARGLEATKQTALHEVAHAIVGQRSQPHDKVWQRKFIELGGDGSREVELDSTSYERLAQTAKYVAKCPNGHSSPMSRRHSTRKSCTTCDPRFNPAFVVKIYDRATQVEVGYAPPRKPRRRALYV